LQRQQLASVTRFACRQPRLLDREANETRRHNSGTVALRSEPPAASKSILAPTTTHRTGLRPLFGFDLVGLSRLLAIENFHHGGKGRDATSLDLAPPASCWACRAQRRVPIRTATLPVRTL